MCCVCVCLCVRVHPWVCMCLCRSAQKIMSSVRALMFGSKLCVCATSHCMSNNLLTLTASCASTVYTNMQNRKQTTHLCKESDRHDVSTSASPASIFIRLSSASRSSSLAVIIIPPEQLRPKIAPRDRSCEGCMLVCALRDVVILPPHAEAHGTQAGCNNSPPTKLT